MTDQNLTLAYSPCPNDTFIFGGIALGLVKSPADPTSIRLEDVETLNGMAMQTATDVCKVSANVLPHILDEYAILKAGAALGRGCGPLVVARQSQDDQDLRNAPVAIPGEHTTANLLLSLTDKFQGPRTPLPFEQIMPAVSHGEFDAGLVIHEGRFTYHEHGLVKLLDLGQWWEEETGLPLPLGCIVMRRSAGPEKARDIERAIRESMALARSRPELVMDYIREHAQELSQEVINEHIATFVNDFSQGLGNEGEAAMRELLYRAAALQNRALPDAPLFASDC